MLSDIDSLDWFLELKVLKENIDMEIKVPVGILEFMNIVNSCSNAWIAYKVLLTISVVIA